VSAGPGDDRVRGFRFRRLEKPEEFRQAEELQRSVREVEAAAAVPSSLQRVLQDNGGVVAGAFADIYLAGCCVATLGWDGTILYYYAHSTVVRPEYQNHHVGYRLMAFLRDEVLRQGLGEIRWAFDPLSSRAAWLSVRRLGGSPDRYLAHYYGRPPDELSAALETDRLRVRWEVGSPAVEGRLAGSGATSEERVARYGSSSAIVETEPGEHGLRVPTSVSEPTGATAHLEIPFDIASIREHEPESLRRWRHAVRDAFRAAFDLGYAVEDFAVITEEHERRSFFLLAKAPPRPTDS
jgi:predicted GNAT superfamily acetyltransferase